jgi:predicted glutamine amidotransferase
MCGLVGMAGNLSFATNKAFRNMLIMDEVRGWDSTGVCVVSNAERVETHKSLGTPDELFHVDVNFDHKGVLKTIPKVLIGHNRAATQGKVTKVNAHPFTFGDITGAHNGTLIDWVDLEGYKVLDVDSKGIFKTINEKGIDHCWSHFRGAAALTWWDAKDKTLNLIRNKERPLHVAYAKKGTIVMWASEAWMIRAAADSIDLDLDEGTKDLTNPFQLLEHHIHTFTVTATDVTLKEVRELKPMAPLWNNYVPQEWGFKSLNKKIAPALFNLGWAKGLGKSGKELVGKKFTLHGALTFEDASKTTLHLLQGRTLEDNKLVQVIPDTLEEWQDLAKVVTAKDTKNNTYWFKTRPRSVMNKVGDTSKVSTYRISINHVDFMENAPVTLDTSSVSSSSPLLDLLGLSKKKKTFQSDMMYQGPNNIPVWDDLVAQEELDKHKCECSYCQQPLTIYDEYRFYETKVSCDVCDWKADWDDPNDIYDMDKWKYGGMM